MKYSCQIYPFLYYN